MSAGSILDTELTSLRDRIEALESAPQTQSPMTAQTFDPRALTYSHSGDAVGNGLTDDYATVQSVLDRVGAAGGGIIAFIKPHAISQSLMVWSNTTLIGTGLITPHSSFIGTLANNNCYLLRNKNWESAFLADKNIHINGLRFDYGNLILSGGGLHAVSIRSAKSCSVSNSIFNGGEDAVAFLNCDSTLVDNCDATNFINCAYDHWVSPRNAIVRNSRATSGNSVQMVNFNPENTFGSSVGNQAVGFKMIGNTLKYTGAGASPCQIEPLSAGTGVSDVQIMGNTFINSCLVVRGMVGRLKISGNDFSNITGNRGAVLLGAQFSARPYYVSVDNNTVSGATTPASGGGVLTVAANWFTVIGNIVDCPSAYVALNCVDGSGVQSGNKFSIGTSGVRQIGVA